MGEWFARGHRDLPWRRTRDPYRIWLSEIMLQQTRAAAAIPYYERFLKKFPTLEALARAPESEVLAAWSGLGYYSRARNLRRAAATIVERGAFPEELAEIRMLPGVGPYTAAAVASIAFGRSHAVLDGNVMRVIARVAADAGDIGAGVTRKRFQAMADGLLWGGLEEGASPGAFNQAMMELGATVCLPREPLCLVCPVAEFCEGRARGVQRQLPVKVRKPAPVEETLELAVVRRGEKVLMRQRAEGSARMAGFWELPDLKDFADSTDKQCVGEIAHTIVNHRYRVRVFVVTARRPAGMEWISEERRGEIPVTTMSRKALGLLRNR